MMVEATQAQKGTPPPTAATNLQLPTPPQLARSTSSPLPTAKYVVATDSANIISKMTLASHLDKKWADIRRGSTSSSVFRANPLDHGHPPNDDDDPNSEHGQTPTSSVNRARVLRSHFLKHLSDVTSVIQAVEVKTLATPHDKAPDASSEDSPFAMLDSLHSIPINFISFFLPSSSGNTHEPPPNSSDFRLGEVSTPTSSSSSSSSSSSGAGIGSDKSLSSRCSGSGASTTEPSPEISSTDDLSWVPRLSQSQRMSPIECRARFLAAQSHVDMTIATNRVSGLSKSVTINLTPMRSVQDGGGFVGAPFAVAPGYEANLGEILGLKSREESSISSGSDGGSSGSGSSSGSSRTEGSGGRGCGEDEEGDDDDDTRVEVDFAINVFHDRANSGATKYGPTTPIESAPDLISPGPVSALIKVFETTRKDPALLAPPSSPSRLVTNVSADRRASAPAAMSLVFTPPSPLNVASRPMEPTPEEPSVTEPPDASPERPMMLPFSLMATRAPVPFNLSCSSEPVKAAPLLPYSPGRVIESEKVSTLERVTSQLSEMLERLMKQQQQQQQQQEGAPSSPKKEVSPTLQHQLPLSVAPYVATESEQGSGSESGSGSGSESDVGHTYKIMSRSLEELRLALSQDEATTPPPSLPPPPNDGLVSLQLFSELQAELEAERARADELHSALGEATRKLDDTDVIPPLSPKSPHRRQTSECEVGSQASAYALERGKAKAKEVGANNGTSSAASDSPPQESPVELYKALLRLQEHKRGKAQLLQSLSQASSSHRKIECDTQTDSEIDPLRQDASVQSELDDILSFDESWRHDFPPEKDSAKLCAKLRARLAAAEHARFQSGVRLEEVLLEAEKQRLQALVEIGRLRRAMDNDRESMETLALDLEGTFEQLALTLASLTPEPVYL